MVIAPTNKRHLDAHRVRRDMDRRRERASLHRPAAHVRGWFPHRLGRAAPDLTDEQIAELADRPMLGQVLRQLEPADKR